jgi:hypothetical protein
VFQVIVKFNWAPHVSVFLSKHRGAKPPTARNILNNKLNHKLSQELSKGETSPSERINRKKLNKTRGRDPSKKSRDTTTMSQAIA